MLVGLNLVTVLGNQLLNLQKYYLDFGIETQLFGSGLISFTAGSWIESDSLYTGS